MSEQEENCCNSPDVVSDTKVVVFEVKDAAHNESKLIHFKLKWCAGCEQIKTLDCTEVI